jgi:transposase-like protein
LAGCRETGDFRRANSTRGASAKKRTTNPVGMRKCTETVLPKISVCMLVGYMSVSIDGDRQVLDLQRDALLAAGVDERHLFEDRASGSRGNRAGLAAAWRRGRRGGRPVAIDAEKMAAIVAALEGGATKAAVCRTFGIKRSTLIDSLARIGWSAGLKMPGSMSDAPTATDRASDRRAVRSADRLP